MSEQTTANRWYSMLATEANSLGEELGLDDMGTQKLRDFLFAKAKDQYKAGNRSGIRWARMNPNAPSTAPQAAVEAAAV